MSDHQHETARVRDADAGDSQAVDPIELFFDLVFVFALTQVTRLMADDLTWIGLLRGMAVLALLWWSWTGFAWLTTTVKTDDVWVRLTMMVSTAVMLLVAIAVPQAFGDLGIFFGFAYLTLRMVHLVLYMVAAREDPDVVRAVVRFMPGAILASLLIVGAGFLDEGPLRAGLWAAAIAADFATPVIGGTSGWRVAPQHFAERHGLVVLIALGESVAAIGLGAQAVELSPVLVYAVLVGVALASVLWWLYFDVVALVATRRLSAASGSDQIAMARDSYTYLHLFLVAGIVLAALGIEESLPHLREPLELVPRTALLGGVALYLLAHVAIRFRNTRTVSVVRFGVAVALLVSVVALRDVEAVWVMTYVTAATVGVAAYESARFRAARHDVRVHDAGGDWVRG